jgi:AraC-like DNA-binding protein
MIEQRPANGDSPLFQPGHLIDLELSHFSELAENAPGWNLSFVQDGAGPLTGKLRVFHTPSLQFASVDFNLGFALAGTIPLGAWSAAVIEGGAVRSRGVPLAPLEFLTDDGQPFEVVFSGPTRHLTLSVSRTLAESCAWSLWREPLPASDRLCFASPARRALFEREALHWLTLGHDKPELLRDAHFTASMETVFLETLLGGCVTTAPLEPPPVRHQAARRARTFILDHLQKPLSVAELCSECNVGQRTLLKGFAEVYGMGPVSYHRQCRLDAVRMALRSGEAPVGKIAMQWGFFHFGRFSQQYRRAFGYPPSRTSQKSRM